MKNNSVIGPVSIFVSLLLIGGAALVYIIKPEAVEYLYREIYTYTAPNLGFLPPPSVEESIVVTEVKLDKPKIEEPEVIQKLKSYKSNGIVKLLPRLSKEEIKPESGPVKVSTKKELYRLLNSCALHGITEVTIMNNLPIQYWARAVEESVYGQSEISYETNKDGSQTWRFFLNDYSRLMQTAYEPDNWVNLTQDELLALENALILISQDAGIKAGMSDYDKAKNLHDALIRRVDYHDLKDSGSVFYLSRNKFVMYALSDDNAICEGYAQVYGFLLSMVGIESYPVSGSCATVSPADDAIDKFKDIGAHAWNIVKINGQWGHVDVTWDDAGGKSPVKYDYFGKSDAWVARHEIRHKNVQSVDNTVSYHTSAIRYRTFGEMSGFMKNGKQIHYTGYRQMQLWDKPAMGWGKE